jgi:predicted metal-dependent phosphoesterase TrpH
MTMKNEHCWYEVFPVVVPADTESTVRIVPRFDANAFSPRKRYEVQVIPTEEFSLRSGWTPDRKSPIIPCEDGSLAVCAYFEGEQEHVIAVHDITDGENRTIGEFRVYSLLPDLMARSPLKGDFHIHSNRSDGAESPPYVAAACRKIGLDFMGVTDHRLYTPSLEAIDFFSENGPLPDCTDLMIFPGEEVHPPESHVHMINFGGCRSANALFADETTYRQSISREIEKIGPVPAGVDPYLYASCVWTLRQIRESGGLAIFCHPYWFTQNRYSPAGALTTHLFDTQPFDAFELIGGFHRFELDSNTLQVARYNEERAKGRRIPIVGSSDSHGCESGELFGWFYSIVFSPTPDLVGIRQSVMDLHSVAVEAVAGETPRVFGPFRLVKYALFLMREVFPAHDRLCSEEGALMMDGVLGASEPATVLPGLRGRTARLWQKQSRQII